MIPRHRISGAGRWSGGCLTNHLWNHFSKDEGKSLSSGAKGLTGRYAGALYALAEEAGKTDVVVADLSDLATLISKNESIKTMNLFSK